MPSYKSLFFFGRAGTRYVAAQKLFTPSRVSLYLFGETVVEILQRQKGYRCTRSRGKAEQVKKAKKVKEAKKAKKK